AKARPDMPGALLAGLRRARPAHARRVGAARSSARPGADPASQGDLGRRARPVSGAAVVLLSGGLDSATTLAIARATGHVCHCLTIDYGQRHRAELDAAKRVAAALGAAEHRVIALDLTAFGGSALTDPGIEVPTNGPSSGIPVTYVPARNTIFLSLALAYAEVRGASDIYFGA